MDAWIDCMTSLDMPDDGMSIVRCAPGTVLTLELNNASDFASRCPEQYEALVHCAEFVNTRRVDIGETDLTPVIRPIVTRIWTKERGRLWHGVSTRRRR